LNTFTEALEALRTAISFLFIDWFNLKPDVFTSYQASLGYIWALFLFKSRSAGFFTQALLVLLSITPSPLGLLITLTFGSGILSAFFLNETSALVFTPLTLSLTQVLGLNPNLLAITGATNIG
jgi:Na+/H+ antiporter NhaD/arsenite permease-like protein